MFKLTQSALALALAMSPVPAAAASIVDTGAPFAPSAGWVLGDLSAFNLPGRVYYAAAFTLANATKVTDIEGFFGFGHGGTFHIGIASSLGATPGAELFSQQVSTPTDRFGDDTIFDWYGAHGINVDLDPGEYWVTYTVPDGDTFRGGMTFYAPNPTVKEAQFRTATGLWSAANDLNFGVRVSGDPLGAIPEPESWALMILGFALTGVAMRRRVGTARPASRPV